MSLLQITAGPRVRVIGHRCHHGMVGAILLTSGSMLCWHHGTLGALLVVAGSVLCWHDRRDAPWLR